MPLGIDGGIIRWEQAPRSYEIIKLPYRLYSLTRLPFLKA